MLNLKGITKIYSAGSGDVTALKGIDVSFRKSEFVSILGPSGCGKTTLLNIIGGLDRYTDGDLIINGKSTKEYSDRDWDYYRNHAIGFVFQNYNLIPHQSVLSNVELALTLSGADKETRVKKAREALERVGLADQINKKPNELSGGQMQRVAIARAIVNDPDIILADEPTGALDTQTSVQIMDLLKEISNDRLVIMVTHNPELAENYSSRIIKIIDGVITDDSDKYDGEQGEGLKEKTGKTSMGFFTALSLSLNNLMTKKGRTLLTSFAGSIGIIGIALILSLSSGMQAYINKVEEDTLSSYPITLEEATVDMSGMLNNFMKAQDDSKDRDLNYLYSRHIMTDMLSAVSNQVQTNNLEAFKDFLENKDKKINLNSNAIQYKYKLNMHLYKPETKDGLVKVNPSTVMEKLEMGEMADQNPMMQTSGAGMDVWRELLDNKKLLDNQYDVIAGHWPENYNEVVLIVDKNNDISDYTLYSLGLFDQEELAEKYKKMLEGKKFKEVKRKKYTFDEILNLRYKLVLNTDYYDYENGIWKDKSDDSDYVKKLVKNAEEIKVVGIVRASENSTMTEQGGIVGYTKDLYEHVVKKINSQKIVKEQKKNKKINVFTGLKFDKNQNSEFSFDSLSDAQKMQLQSMSDEEIAILMQSYTENAGATYEGNLLKLGVVDLDKPSTILIYPRDFDAKENITDAIERYNNRQKRNNKEDNEIHYTDLVGTMISSMTTIVDVISYILIAFVAISLVVSSIMIGIITYISVLERTKEIGILRAIGSSKKDISRVFRAETIIEGFAAGVLGIGITLLFNIPINLVISTLFDIHGIAKLPLQGAIILVVISVLLTMIAGLMPSKVAAKKDPVVALRTE